MTEAFCWSLLRVLIAVTVALFAALRLNDCFRRRSCGSRMPLLPLSLIAFAALMPELLVGFGWRLAASHLAQSPGATEAVYLGLMIVRGICIGCCLLQVIPLSDAADAAELTWKMQPSAARLGMVQVWKASGVWRVPLLLWSLMAVLSFQEFETAALMQIDRHPIAWPVTLFDEHFRGLPLSTTLGLAVLPAAGSLILLLPAVPALRHRLPLLSHNRSLMDDPISSSGGTQAPGNHNSHLMPRSSPGGVGWSFALIAFLLLVVYPIYVATRGAFAGFTSLLSSSSAMTDAVRQVAESFGFACCSSLCSLSMAWLVPVSRSRLAAVLLVLPGLAGAFVCAVVVLAVCRLPGMQSIYDSWLPLVAGQTLAVFPRALLLVLLLRSVLTPTGAATLAIAERYTKPEPGAAIGRVRSRLVRGPWILAGGLIAFWAFWNVTAASVLQPLGHEPVVTRLYNEVHYGRTERLAAMVGLSVILPLLLVGMIWWCFRLSATLFFRRRSSSTRDTTS